MKKIKIILISLLFSITTLIIVAYASSSYRANNWTTITINEHAVCKKVVNNSWLNYFVPTNNTTEWSAFRNNLPWWVTINWCPEYPWSWVFSKWNNWTVSVTWNSTSANVNDTKWWCTPWNWYYWWWQVKYDFWYVSNKNYNVTFNPYSGYLVACGAGLNSAHTVEASSNWSNWVYVWSRHNIEWSSYYPGKITFSFSGNYRYIRIKSMTDWRYYWWNMWFNSVSMYRE